MAKEKLSRAEKKRLKQEKWEDPLGIDKMSDEEFLERLPELQKKTAFGGVGGTVLFIVCIILLAVFWDKIFYG